MGFSMQEAGQSASSFNGARPYASAPRPQFGFARRFYMAVLVTVLVLVYLNIPNYGNTINSALLPKYYYFALACLLYPLLLKSKALTSYLLSPFALWAFGFIVLNLIHLFGGAAGGNAARVQLIEMRIQYMVLAILLGFAFSNARTVSYEWIFPFIAVVAPLMVILDFIAPGMFYPPGTVGTVPGRASATYINPTIAGEVILLTFLMACQVVKMAYRTPLLILAGVGIILTFSRSSIIAWIALWALLQFRRVLPRSALVYILIGLFTIPILMAGFESYLGGRHDLAEAINDLESRLNFFSTNMKLNDDSAEGRRTVLEAGWDLFLRYPVEGAGAGATAVWSHGLSTHNQAVLLAAEYGFLGIVVWGVLAILLLTGKYFNDKSLQLAAFFIFVFSSMFTHNMFDMLHWLVMFALVSRKKRV